jgi:succinate dehydrogenase hydrophobic anchor subunit
VETAFGIITILVLVLVPVYLVSVMIKTIRDERRSSNVRKIWANFALSIVLCLLFFVSWGGQAVSQWRSFVQEQRDHNEVARAGEFLMDFGQSTLENWQSEFLQLFSFVVLAAAYIHHGSGESKDGTDRVEEMLKRVVKKLDA